MAASLLTFATVVMYCSVLVSKPETSGQIFDINIADVCPVGTLHIYVISGLQNVINIHCT